MQDKNGKELIITDKTRPLLRSDRFSSGADALVAEVTNIDESFIEFRQRRRGEVVSRLTQEELLRSAWVYHGTVKIDAA
jgi:hypothetical protein